jgi:hypothetical protein
MHQFRLFHCNYSIHQGFDTNAPVYVENAPADVIDMDFCSLYMLLCHTEKQLEAQGS